MKRLLIAAVAALALGAAFADDAKKAAYVDPNPFADYGPAMRSTEKDPLAAKWSIAHDAEIAAATDESVLAAFVADAAAADALLAKVKGAYETDPVVMTQIAAVTQWVMLPEPFFLFFWKPSPADGREVWKAALSRRIAGSSDGYVRTFCQQQLDLCK